MLRLRILMELGYTNVESAILAILEPVLVEKVRGEASEAPPLTFCSQTRQSATSIETMRHIMYMETS